LWAPGLFGFDELPPDDRLLPDEDRELPPEGRLLPAEERELPPEDRLLPAEERELPPDDRLLLADGRELLPVDPELPTDRPLGAEERPELLPTELRDREVDPRTDEDPEGDVVGRL